MCHVPPKKQKKIYIIVSPNLFMPHVYTSKSCTQSTLTQLCFAVWLKMQMLPKWRSRTGIVLERSRGALTSALMRTKEGLPNMVFFYHDFTSLFPLCDDLSLFLIPSSCSSCQAKYIKPMLSCWSLLFPPVGLIVSVSPPNAWDRHCFDAVSHTAFLKRCLMCAQAP